MARIVQTNGHLGGKPRIAGTRISVDIIGDYIAYGYGVKEIKEAYPHLTNDQISAAFKYIEKRVKQERRKLEVALIPRSKSV